MYIHTFQERWLQENHLPQVTKTEKTYNFCFGAFCLDRLPHNDSKKQFLSDAHRIAKKRILQKSKFCSNSYIVYFHFCS